MLVADTELAKAYANALRALGHPYGVAVDAALVLRWFDENGLGGIGRFFHLHDCLKTSAGATATITHRDPTGPVELDMQGAALPVIAPAAVDFGIALFRREGRRHLRLNNLSGIGLACGLLNLAHIREQQLCFRWLGVQGDSGRYCGNGRVQFQTDVMHSESETGTLHLEFTEDASVGSSDFAHLPTVFDGIEVDDRNWSDLTSLAREMLVPESDESRRRGAGQGADG